MDRDYDIAIEERDQALDRALAAEAAHQAALAEVERLRHEAATGDNAAAKAVLDGVHRALADVDGATVFDKLDTLRGLLHRGVAIHDELIKRAEELELYILATANNDHIEIKRTAYGLGLTQGAAAERAATLEMLREDILACDMAKLPDEARVLSAFAAKLAQHHLQAPKRPADGSPDGGE